MLADFGHLLVGELAGLVEQRGGNEGLADVVQQRGAGQAALVVLAHAEMLREGDGEAGDEQAVPIAADMVATHRGEPFAQRGMLDRLQDLAFGGDDVVEGQGTPSGSFSNIFASNACAASTPRLRVLPRSVAS